jgi:hypothetical protein
VLHQRRLGIDLDLSRRKGSSMKIVVIGGSGLIGSKTVAILRRTATRSLPPRPKAASTPSPVKGSKKPWSTRPW